MLGPVFNATRKPWWGYNFRRHLAKAGPQLSEALARHDPSFTGIDIVVRPATSADIEDARTWKQLHGYKNHGIAFDWGQLLRDDERANAPGRRRMMAAFTANGVLCGFSHMMMQPNGQILMLTQKEGRPGPHPLKGVLNYCGTETALTVAKGLGAAQLWGCGPFYNPVAAAQYKAQGFRPYDDGRYVHYTLKLKPDTRLDPAIFIRRTAGAAAPSVTAPHP